MPPAQATAFIRANTRLLTPPLVPEIRLHLAEESLPIWQKTEEELGQINVPPPFWAFAWAGGQAIARYLLDHPPLVAGQTVLDLGSGSGIAAIAAKIAGAAEVTANDIDAFANAACRLNATANNVELRIEPGDLITPPAPPAAPSTDLIILADVFYERDLARHILAYAERACERAPKTTILVGDPNRSYFPAERFTKMTQYAVPVTRELEDSEIKTAAVWTFDH